MATKIKSSAIEDALTAAIAALPQNCVPPSCAEIYQKREDWKARMKNIDAQLQAALTELVALESQRDALLADADPAALKTHAAAVAELRDRTADLELIRSKLPQRLAQLDKEYWAAFAKAQAAGLRDLRRLLYDPLSLEAIEHPLIEWEERYMAIFQILSGLAQRWCALSPPLGGDAVHRRVEGDAGEPALPAYQALPTGLTVDATLGELVHAIMANPAVQRRLRRNGHRS